jgi:hypothetical protein
VTSSIRRMALLAIRPVAAHQPVAAAGGGGGL